MTKTELIAAIAAVTSLKKTEVAEVLDQLEGEVHAALYRGEDVTVPGLGKLSTKDRPARTARNPRNGEPIEVPARKVVQFKPSKELRDFVARI